jgi:hypothetical protein
LRSELFAAWDDTFISAVGQKPPRLDVVLEERFENIEGTSFEAFIEDRE